MRRTAFCLDCPGDVNVSYRGLPSILAAVKITGFKPPYQEQLNNPDPVKVPPSDGKNLTLMRILPWVVDLDLAPPPTKGHRVPVFADPDNDLNVSGDQKHTAAGYKGLVTHGQSGDGTVRY